jgi:ABC-type antimicrobial peptide transport system permease subunit
MVERRTGEIGVRMALGADRGRVIRMVLVSAIWQIGAGLTLGISASLATSKLMTTQLFGVQPRDPVMLALATLLLTLAALFASALPAWRAAGVEPMAALRID